MKDKDKHLRTLKKNTHSTLTKRILKPFIFLSIPTTLVLPRLIRKIILLDQTLHKANENLFGFLLICSMLASQTATIYQSHFSVAQWAGICSTNWKKSVMQAVQMNSTSAVHFIFAQGNQSFC